MVFSAKPSPQFRNGRFFPLKCRKTTNARADMSMNDLKRGDQGQSAFRELLIEEIPHVDEVVKRLSLKGDTFRKTESDLLYLEEAYERCTAFVGEHEKLMFSVFGQLPKDKRQATWAIYAWARRIDDLIDSTNDDTIRSEYLDLWEARTKDILNGLPHDILDAALVDAISKFHMDSKPFEDGIEGMRMDIRKNRYANFEELFLYCYHVAGTLGLMHVQIVGIAPESTVSSKTIYDGAVYALIALQLTNILKDVSEDAQLGRIYLPQDELARFGLCDEDIFSRKVSDGWKEFMKMQIQRVRFYYNLGEQGVSQYDKASRAKLLSVLMVYGQILDEIEEDYDNLTNKIGSQF